MNRFDFGECGCGCVHETTTMHTRKPKRNIRKIRGLMASPNHWWANRTRRLLRHMGDSRERINFAASKYPLTIYTIGIIIQATSKYIQ